MNAEDALQEVLAAEHAAMFVLASLGGVVSEASEPGLRAALDAAFSQHRERRDRLQSRIRELGGRPVPAAPAYDLPPDLGSIPGVQSAALEVEQTCAATYADAVAGTSGPDRSWAIAALNDAAVRELAFGGRPVAFPGLDELADR